MEDKKYHSLSSVNPRTKAAGGINSSLSLKALRARNTVPVQYQETNVSTQQLGRKRIQSSSTFLFSIQALKRLRAHPH